MEDLLSEKHVCLVLSCMKEKYVKRLDENMKTFLKIRDAGFLVFFLYGGLSGEEIYIEETHELNIFRLSVRIDEIYKNIPLKVYAAFSFFCRFPINGILKMDDDVHIHDDSVLDLGNFKYDYIGGEYADVYSFKKLEDAQNSEYLQNLKKQDRVMRYFGGPFYWVSGAAIQRILAFGVRTEAEDLNTGLALSEWKECKVANPFWRRSGAVSWGEPEEGEHAND